MLRIREIAEDELQELVDVAKRRCRARTGGVASFVDWRGRPRTWSGCSRSATARRSARASRSPAGTRRRTARSGRRSSRRSTAAPASGRAAATRSRAGPRDHGATELDGPVAEDDEGSLAWASAPRLRGGRPQLAARARPDRDRGARADAAAGRRDRHLGRAARARRRALRGRARGGAGHPGRGGGRHRHARGVARARHGGASDDPRRSSSRSRTARSLGYAKLSLLQERDRPRLPRPHRRQARAPRPRDRGGAEARRRSPGRRSNGYTSLQTSNEVRNEPIRRLNEQHGYVLEPGVVIVRGAIG